MIIQLSTVFVLYISKYYANIVSVREVQQKSVKGAHFQYTSWKMSRFCPTSMFLLCSSRKQAQVSMSLRLIYGKRHP